MASQRNALKVDSTPYDNSQPVSPSQKNNLNGIQSAEKEINKNLNNAVKPDTIQEDEENELKESISGEKKGEDKVGEEKEDGGEEEEIIESALAHQPLSVELREYTGDVNSGFDSATYHEVGFEEIQLWLNNILESHRQEQQGAASTTSPPPPTPPISLPFEGKALEIDESDNQTELSIPLKSFISFDLDGSESLMTKIFSDGSDASQFYAPFNFDSNSDGIYDGVYYARLNGDGPFYGGYSADFNYDGIIDTNWVLTDLDGDGLVDIDINQDGIPDPDLNDDHIADLDLNGDGIPDFYTLIDTNFDGAPDKLFTVDFNGDGIIDGAYYSTFIASSNFDTVYLGDINNDGNPDGNYYNIFTAVGLPVGVFPADINGDGVAPDAPVDVNGDSISDNFYLVDTNNDGIIEHTVYHVDTTGDGIPDGLFFGPDSALVSNDFIYQVKIIFNDFNGETSRGLPTIQGGAEDGLGNDRDIPAGTATEFNFNVSFTEGFFDSVNGIWYGTLDMLETVQMIVPGDWATGIEEPIIGTIEATTSDGKTVSSPFSIQINEVADPATGAVQSIISEQTLDDLYHTNPIILGAGQVIENLSDTLAIFNEALNNLSNAFNNNEPAAIVSSYAQQAHNAGIEIFQIIQDLPQIAQDLTTLSSNSETLALTTALADDIDTAVSQLLPIADTFKDLSSQDFPSIISVGNTLYEGSVTVENLMSTIGGIADPQLTLTAINQILNSLISSIDSINGAIDDLSEAVNNGEPAALLTGLTQELFDTVSALNQTAQNALTLAQRIDIQSSNPDITALINNIDTNATEIQNIFILLENTIENGTHDQVIATAHLLHTPIINLTDTMSTLGTTYTNDLNKALPEELEIQQDSAVLIPLNLDLSPTDMDNSEYISAIIIKGFGTNGLMLINNGDEIFDPLPGDEGDNPDFPQFADFALGDNPDEGNVDAPTVRLSHVEEINGELVPVWVVEITDINSQSWNNLFLYGPSPEHFSGVINLQIEVITTEFGSGDSRSTILNHEVLVEPVTDDATLHPDNTSIEICEDTFYEIDATSLLQLQDTDGSEIAIGMTLSNIPPGVTLSIPTASGLNMVWAATDDNNSFTIDLTQLPEGETFSIRAPENSNESFSLYTTIHYQDGLLDDNGNHTPYGEIKTAAGSLHFDVIGVADDFVNSPHPEEIIYSDPDGSGTIPITGFTPALTADNDGSESIIYLAITTLPGLVLTSPGSGEGASDTIIGSRILLAIEGGGSIGIIIGGPGGEEGGDFWILTQEEVSNGLQITNFGDPFDVADLGNGELESAPLLLIVPISLENDIDLSDFTSLFTQANNTLPKGINIGEEEVTIIEASNIGQATGEIIEVPVPQFVPNFLASAIVTEDDGNAVPFTLTNSSVDGESLVDYPFADNLSVIVNVTPGSQIVLVNAAGTILDSSGIISLSPLNGDDTSFIIDVNAFQEFQADPFGDGNAMLAFLPGENQALATDPTSPFDLSMKIISILERGDGTYDDFISEAYQVNVFPIDDLPQFPETLVINGNEIPLPSLPENALEDEVVTFPIVISLTDQDGSEEFLTLDEILNPNSPDETPDGVGEDFEPKIVIITPTGVFLDEAAGTGLQVVKIGGSFNGIEGEVYLAEAQIIGENGFEATITLLNPIPNGHGEIPILVGAFPIEDPNNLAMLEEADLDDYFKTLSINIHAVADKPLINGSSEDQDIVDPVIITPNEVLQFSDHFPLTLVDTDGSEQVAVRIDNLPDFMLETNLFRNDAGETIGTFDPINNSYVFTLEEYQQLKLDLPDDLSGLIFEDLRITVTTRESSNGDAAQTELTFDLRVETPFFSTPDNINLIENEFRTTVTVPTNSVGLSFFAALIPLNGIMINDTRQLTNFSITINNLHPDDQANLVSTDVSGTVWGTYEANSHTWVADLSTGAPDINDQLDNLRLELGSEVFSLFHPEPITLAITATTIDGIQQQSITVTSTGTDDVITGTPTDDNFDNPESEPILGGDGDDILVGNSGDDFIAGGEGDDLLFGNEGSDLLYGGPGQNTLSGGEDSDIFLFDPFDLVINGDEVNNPDIVTDFDATAGDSIWITIRDDLNFDQDNPELHFEFLSSGGDTTLVYHVDGDGGASGNTVPMAAFIGASFSMDSLQTNNQIEFVLANGSGVEQ